MTASDRALTSELLSPLIDVQYLISASDASDLELELSPFFAASSAAGVFLESDAMEASSCLTGDVAAEAVVVEEPKENDEDCDVPAGAEGWPNEKAGFEASAVFVVKVDESSVGAAAGVDAGAGVLPKANAGLVASTGGFA